PELRLREAAREGDLDGVAALRVASLVVRLVALVAHHVLAVLAVPHLAAHLDRDRLRHLVGDDDANDGPAGGTLAGHGQSFPPVGSAATPSSRSRSTPSTRATSRRARSTKPRSVFSSVVDLKRWSNISLRSRFTSSRRSAVERRRS